MTGNEGCELIFICLARRDAMNSMVPTMGGGSKRESDAAVTL